MVSQQLHPDALGRPPTPADHNFDANRARCSRAASLAGGAGGDRGLLSLLRPAAPARRHSAGYCTAPANAGVLGAGSAGAGGGFKYCPSDALPYCPPSRPSRLQQKPIQIQIPVIQRPTPPPPIPLRVPAVPKRSPVALTAPAVPPLVVPPPPRRSSPQPTPVPRITPPAPPPPPPPARNLPPPDKNSHLYTMFTPKQPNRSRENQNPPPLRKQQNQTEQPFTNMQYRTDTFENCNNNLTGNIINACQNEQDHNQNTQKTNSYKKNVQSSQKNINQVMQDSVNSNRKISNVPPPLTSVPSNQSNGGKVSLRQDSSVSSDSFSQTSSPSYTTKTMEAPLLPHHHTTKSSRLCSKLGPAPPAPPPMEDVGGGSPLTKSASTPASLQTIVRFQNGSNMSLHHKIIRDMRRSSNPYVTQGRLKFRFAQVVVNVIALLAIAGGFCAYFRAYPSIQYLQVVNKTVTTSTTLNTSPVARNPAPGVCLPVIVSFCQYHRVPYNFTVFPNYIGHFGQRDAQQELEVYDAVVDVRCYELAALFLCSVFVPKCGPLGHMVRPCRSLCMETMRRCGFFLDVFGLTMPDYLQCSFFPETTDTDVCVGHREVREARLRAQKPVCPTGFQCDTKRCIPADWRCDGHVDCLDQSDELNCKSCGRGTIHCGERRCMAQSHVCDGKVDCPWGQDERNCLRLSESNGDIAKGQLQLFRPQQQRWQPACVAHWDQASPGTVCAMLGYSNANYTSLTTTDGSELTIAARQRDPSLWRMYRERDTNLLKEFRTCGATSSNVNLVCTNYVCGKTRQVYAKPSNRIIGGVEAAPGEWPFLAAILGGPEEVFYCAGVLIADQWVLTASHCVGNHSDVSGWTIQLGITRRHAHSYYGQKMKVRRVLPHPLYNLGVAHDNDVALFQLASRVTFHEQLLPVCLPPASRQLPEGTLCTVIGWGKREDKDMSEYEPAVNEVQVPVLNRELCNSWLEDRDLNVTEGMICAGYPEGGKDACQGDSGGPLLCRDPDDKDRWFVGGIVSWGIKCAHPRLPGVYAFVPRYVPWIRQMLELHSD